LSEAKAGDLLGVEVVPRISLREIRTTCYLLRLLEVFCVIPNEKVANIGGHRKAVAGTIFDP
jgi:hypothetical protein